MNPAQEAILDRLAGTEKVGRLWKSGPLGLAVQALRDRQLVGHSDAGRALGFPMMLCNALQGASSVLKSVNDRCTLGVSFFTEAAPRERPPRLSRTKHVELALWCMEQSHPLACATDCPYFQETRKFGRSQPENRPIDWNGHRGLILQCPSGPADRLLTERRKWENSPQGFAYLAVQGTWYAIADVKCPQPKSPLYYTNKVGRDAARVVTLVKGVEGAVSFCVGLAREIGI